MFRAGLAILLLGSFVAWCAPPPLVDPLIFDYVRFEVGETGNEATLRPFQQKELREIADELKASRLYVLIVGSADASEGSESECKIISEARALFVYNWLAAQGLSAQLKGHKGVCKVKPAGGREAESPRWGNRRVDVVIDDQA